ncbi:GRB10 interacting GYF protein 1 [Bulinus truncatus]|nr:GRB10 interacting GYF protein 1 [Bulinus truncatus]
MVKTKRDTNSAVLEPETYENQFLVPIQEALFIPHQVFNKIPPYSTKIGIVFFSSQTCFTPATVFCINRKEIIEMALKFGPQWLRDLSDGGTNSSQPSTPTTSVKFKLADYRYGREEMLALYNEHSTPPDQVRKHLSIFSKEIQKPITMLPLTEDEQRLVSQGFNSTVVLRAASRGSGPPLRSSRGGGAPDWGRGRGRGRGEGYLSRTENGDIAYSRSTQDGWEQVGRKFERSFSRGYDEIGPKREYVRSSSDNWRDKKLEDEDDEEEGGAGWRNNRERWGPSTRTNWREPQRENFEIDRRPLHPRNFDPDSRVTQRTNESYDNEGDVPEWVADDVGDDPGTFDSSGAFVSTRQGKKYIEIRREPPPTEDSVKNNVTIQSQEDRPKQSESTKTNSEKSPPVQSNKSVYIPPNARSGNGDSNDSKEIILKQNIDKGETESHSETQISFSGGHSNKGAGDSGFSLPNPELVSDMRSPPGQNLPYTPVPNTQPEMTLLNDPSATQIPNSGLLEMDRLQLEKSLQNYVAEMTAGAERRAKSLLETPQPSLPVNSEEANKWFYKDPQGEVQGPFTSEEMSQWFSAGYFTMSLIVKRGCDDTYKPLGELIKRYGRVPFLPGPPLPPLITNSMTGEATITTTPPLAIVPPLPAPIIGAPLMNVSDPHIVQQMLIQQEFIKQTYLRQLQQLQQLQDPESFKTLTPEQHIPMQMLMQANPALLLQHQLLFQQQQQQQEQSLASVAYTGDATPTVFQQSSSNNSSSTQNTAPSGMWPLPTTHIPSQPPTSLWDIDTNSSGAMSPAYRAQLEKLKRDREEERLKEEEKAREEELQKKKEELLRQQEEIERQREQMRREKEELERQKLLEIQKIEEARRLEEERIQSEIERQQREKEEEERRLQEITKKHLEAERKKEKELEKLEKKKRKEEEKRLEEERRRANLASAEKLVAQKKAEEELRKQQEIEQQQREERMQKEAAEREKLEVQKKQLDSVKQQEAFRKLQQSQRDQLAHIQLPASSNWAALQQPSLFPSQSKSLTEIQEEEARQEEERLREQQFLQLQRIQEQFSSNQSHQISQKSWATQNSQVTPSKGFSLLHIQQQEAEKAKKSEKEKINNNSYTSKVALSSNSTWTGSGGTWGSSQPVWSNALSSTAGFWDSVAAPVKKSNVKESGEFPALKMAPSQQLKKTNTKEVKASTVKTPAPKLKKEEHIFRAYFKRHFQKKNISKPHISCQLDIGINWKMPLHLFSSKKSDVLGVKINQAPKGIKAFYKRQDELIAAYENMATDSKLDVLSRGAPEPGVIVTRFSQISFAANLALMIAKAVAVGMSNSMSIISSLVDSVVDLLSGLIIWWTTNAIRKSSIYVYPVGRSRLEPVAIIVLSVIMSLASLEVLISSIKKMVEFSSSLDNIASFEIPTLIIACSIVVVKFVLAVSFYLIMKKKKIQSDPVDALIQDHRNDTVSNLVAIVCGYLGSQQFANEVGTQQVAYIDPVGAVIIGLNIIIGWWRTGIAQLKMIVGYTANPDFLSQITWISLNHSHKILCIDTVRAFHFGSKFLVEVDIVLKEDTVLLESHNIGESLQQKLEGLPQVERAFVHVDYEVSHRPQDEHK